LSALLEYQKLAYP